MQKITFIVLLFLSTSAFNQTTKITVDWNNIINNNKIPQREALWLKSNLTASELKEISDLVSSLSQPAASQLLVSYFYLDGSFKHQLVRPYLDSLSIRPPNGEAGIVRVAYLASQLQKTLIDYQKQSKYYISQFNGSSFKLPEVKETNTNKNIELSFDYEPAEIILDILSRSDISYKEILEKIMIYKFDKLIDHHNQSFYTVPLTKEQLAICLQIASSTKPIDQLYKYINPDGLLYFTDVKNNIVHYQRQIKYLRDNEQLICKYINASVAPLLPANTKFSRKVSFFFINGADGWASNDITAIDLNYYKDDYQKLLRLLVHETYHSGQNAIIISDQTKRKENIQSFVDVTNAVFMEGTASFVAPPDIKTKDEYNIAITEGAKLLEDIYENTIVYYNANKVQELYNKGISSAGPFYQLGSEMSKVIVDELGKEKLASIIPYGGITFFNTYFTALRKANQKKNLFSTNLTTYVTHLK